MNNEHLPDWDATSNEVMRDPRPAYDDMRRRCPVAHNQFGGWTLFRHEDVLRAVQDHETFSNAVSQHLSVPNGMDPPEHTEYRRIIEPYFGPGRMKTFEPVCRDIARELVSDLETRGEVEFMSEVAVRFAVGVQCAFLGWPASLHGTLVRWMRRNQEATLAQDRKAMSLLAREFEAIIDELLETRRRSGAGPETDITASLMHEKAWGRPLTNEEVASILRNWTAGEIGTISSATGIIGHFLATHLDVQRDLRTRPERIPAAIEEILRIHGPLVSNRRVTKKPIEVGGQKVGAGERITLNWISANRDERVFPNPDEFRMDRDQSANLLYGAGIHVCPGAPLARLELRVFTEELLGASAGIELVPGKEPALAVYPASGYSVLVVRVQ